MSAELSDIIITIDTREQNQKRIKAVEDWGVAHGACVEHSKLDLCDYRIMGEFRGVPVDLGIEAKGLSDFCSCDYEDLKQKLFNSFELYDEVALFIESGNYSFQSNGFGKSVIINSAVRDGSANVCNLAQLEGCSSTLAKYDIHVRHLRSEAQFPYSIENLLTYVTNNHSITRNGEISKWEYIVTYRNALSRIKGINTKKRLDKIMKSYPNLFWLTSTSEESLIQVMGRQVGMTIYAMLRAPYLVTPEWSNQHFPDGTEIEERTYDTQDVIKAVTEYLQEFPDGKTAEELCIHFNIMHGDEDKEKFLECLKKMAYRGLITNTVTGLFHIPITKLQSLSIAQERGAKPPVTQSAKSKLGTHDTFMSQCDPAEREGTFLTKHESRTHNSVGQTPISPSPADDNNKGFYKVSVESFEVLPLSPLEKVVAETWANKYNHNDKTDKSGSDSSRTSQEPIPLSKAPVLSESYLSNNPVRPDAEAKLGESGSTPFADIPTKFRYASCNGCGKNNNLNINGLCKNCIKDRTKPNSYKPVSQIPIEPLIKKVKDRINSSLKLNYCSKCGFQVPDDIALNCQKRKKLTLCDDCDDDLFGKINPDWKPVDAEELAARKKDNGIEDEDFEIQTADHKMSIRKQLEVFLDKPHTQQECVNKLSNFSKGAVSDHIFHMKREGMIVEFDNKTLVMTK